MWSPDVLLKSLKSANVLAGRLSCVARHSRTVSPTLCAWDVKDFKSSVLEVMIGGYDLGVEMP